MCAWRERRLHVRQTRDIYYKAHPGLGNRSTFYPYRSVSKLGTVKTSHLASSVGNGFEFHLQHFFEEALARASKHSGFPGTKTKRVGPRTVVYGIPLRSNDPTVQREGSWYEVYPVDFWVIDQYLTPISIGNTFQEYRVY